MAQIEAPKLPRAKLGIAGNKKSGFYYYVQTYTHHYDPVKKRSVRDSQKTIGKVLGGEKYGKIEFKQFFLDEHPELENFDVFWTADGFEVKTVDEDNLSVVPPAFIEKRMAGASWALQKAMGQMGVGSALKSVFSKYHRHLKLASIAIYMIIRQSNILHNYEPFSKVTWLPWGKSLNDGQIHHLFSSVTDDDLMNFYKALHRFYLDKFGNIFSDRVFVALDSTSISTYSGKLSNGEWGHNKDGDSTRQINYLHICDEATGLPIYGKLYKGNVVDVSTVQNLIADLAIIMGTQKKLNLTVVTDRGYDSDDNLQDFVRNGFNFLQRSCMKSKWIQDVVEQNRAKLVDDNSYESYSKQHMYTTSVEYYYDSFPVDGKKKSNRDVINIYVHMYFDEDIYHNARSVAKKNTVDARDEYNEKIRNLYATAKIDNIKVTPEMLSKVKLKKGMQEFIDSYCKFDSEGYAVIDSEAIDEHVKYAGIMVLLSDNVSEPREALFGYNCRRRVEEHFQTFKDHLNFNRAYASSDKAFKGKFLCQFIAASLYMFLERRIKEYEATDAARKDKIKLTNKSMSRIIDDLNTIMLTSYKGGYFFDEVCGKYRTYFNALGIEVPEAKHDYKDQVNITDGATDEDPDYEAEDSAMTLASGEEI